MCLHLQFDQDAIVVARRAIAPDFLTGCPTRPRHGAVPNEPVSRCPVDVDDNIFTIQIDTIIPCLGLQKIGGVHESEGDGQHRRRQARTWASWPFDHASTTQNQMQEIH